MPSLYEACTSPAASGSLRQSDAAGQDAVVELGAEAVRALLLGPLLALRAQVEYAVADAELHVVVRVDARQLRPDHAGVAFDVLLDTHEVGATFEHAVEHALAGEEVPKHVAEHPVDQVLAP